MATFLRRYFHYLIYVFLISIGLFSLIFYTDQQDGFVHEIHGARMWEKLSKTLNDKVNANLSAYENLLIDVDCYNKLAENERCRLPVRVASFLMNSSDKNLLIDYKLELPESGDYIVLNGSPKRLLPKILINAKEIELNDGAKVSVSLPQNPSMFLRHLRDSIFIESKRMKMNRTVNKQGIDLKAAQTAIRSVRLKVEDIAHKIQQPITVFLTCGTLLGCYRENSIIPHTSDLDFAVKQEDLSNRSEEFIQHVESSFEMRDRIGFMNSSLEFRLTMPNVEVDLFIHYHDLNDPQKRDYVPGFDFNNNQTVFWHSPHVKELCAGVLLQSLVYVPCNVEELLVAYYGNEWTIDCETRKCNYRKDIITQRGQKYTKEQMKEVIKLPSRKST